MKRLLSFLVCLSIFLSTASSFTCVCSASALESYPSNEIVISQTTMQLPDGNSVYITVSEAPIATYATSYSKSGTKTYSLKDANNDVVWTFSIRGTFSVTTGVSAVCTAVTHSYNISNTAWSYSSGSSYYTGNQAIGNGEFVRKVLFVTMETKTCQVTLSCDANGTLS